MRVFTPQQMRAVDAASSAGGADVSLMRTAGERIAEMARRCARGWRIVAFAGSGNNGGDAFAALARLPASFERIVYADLAESPSAARRDAERRAAEAGVLMRALPQTLDEARKALEGCGLALDGLLGTGARLPLPQKYDALVTALNESAAPVLAIDVPSGTVDADVTVTLGALKVGLLLGPARSLAGELWLADIGLSEKAIAEQAAEFAALDDAEFLQLLPKRAQDSDKRKAGAPLIIAGSEQFPGAAVLSALGAARAGAGYVTVAAPKGALPALRAHLIEQVVVELTGADDLIDVAGRCSAIGIGPGLGLDDGTGAIVRDFVKRCDLPIVADASALFHFAKHLDMLRDKRIVLTPHEGEFARLSGKGTIKPGERADRLREFVDRTGITTLLKGDATLIYDGNVMHVNTTGTPLLATAGTGDVLTGMIATLLSQGLAPVDAARVGAYWHGLAARKAGAQRQVGVIARDVADALGSAIPPEPPHGKLVRIY
ncbi:MAG TPA: NAD(P)H-hydrate dehydratase [Candidatus Rubrimentiphilum sp.]|nr:NAD(P)H-hydrate dehydratase [Candidatus Rubrimentiphilum sp.]